MKVLVSFLACLAIMSGHASAAEAYPSKPVRIVIGQAAGGGTYILARLLASGLSSKWGHAVVVDAKPGASGTIGSSLVANATPDGHTLLFAGNPFVIPPEDTQLKLSFDPIKSFIPISMMATSSDFLLVHPSLAANNAKEFIALARAKPGQLNFSTAGTSSLQYLIMKALIEKAGINMVHVPYNGGAPALTAVVANEVHAAIGGQVGSVPLVQAGKLRALAVTSITRSKRLPDVPTVSEALGLPDFNYIEWFGLLAPARTPGAVVTQLHRNMVEVMNTPDSQREMTKLGYNIVANSPAEFAKTITSEVHEFWGARYVK